MGVRGKTELVCRVGRRAALLSAVFAAGAIWLTRAAFADDSRAGGAGIRVFPDCRNDYRHQGILSDFILGRTWIVYASCSHPEIPRVAFEAEDIDRKDSQAVAIAQLAATGEAVRFAAPALAANFAPSRAPRPVLAGSRVRLWKKDSRVRIEMNAVALEGAESGGVVRVRVLPAGPVLKGVVRAAGSVELAETSGFSGAAQ